MDLETKKNMGIIFLKNHKNKNSIFDLVFSYLRMLLLTSSKNCIIQIKNIKFV